MIPKVTIELSTTTIALMAIFLFVGYFMGNTFPLSGNSVAVQPNQVQPTQVPSQPSKVTVDFAGEPYIGSDNAKVVVVEFTDYQCPFCKRSHDTTYPQLKTEYIDTGKVKYITRDFPLPFHTEADEAAEAAGCAFEQGNDKFWLMHDLLFEKQDEWVGKTDPKPVFKGYAKELGLNSASFDSCLDSGKRRQEVEDDYSAGSGYGVSGTPTFYINGVELVGAQPYSAFKQTIDAEL